MRGLVMSRSLGRRARYKELDARTSPQGQGAAAFKEGKPRTECPYSSAGLGRGHAGAARLLWGRHAGCWRYLEVTICGEPPVAAKVE